MSKWSTDSTVVAQRIIIGHYLDVFDGPFHALAALSTADDTPLPPEVEDDG